MLSQKLVLAAAGNAAAAIYVDDVFSTYLYDGTGSAQTITNGIDLSGEGGLVWAKSRSQRNHILSDTERGTGKVLFSNLDIAEDADSTTITSYNSNGFTMGGSALKMNTSGEKFCSWTFRKCPGFFDIVTYTGNGSNRTISHNLGSVPGSIWIKKRNSSDNWVVYHRSTGETDYGRLNTTDEFFDEATFWNDTAPTSSVFSVGTVGNVNDSGDTYVAYLFAHDDQSFGDDGDEAIIKCGNYTGNGGTQSINVGFEPQFLITKRIDSSGNWFIHDIMRKFSATGTDEAATLRAHSNLGEYTNTARIHVNSTGFDFDAESSSDVNASSGSYIYIAIRRPHKPPETAAECFDVFEQTGSSSTQLRPGTSGSGVTDMAIIKNADNNYDWVLGARLLGGKNLIPNSTAAESTSKFGTVENVWDQMSGTELQSGVAGTNFNSSNNYVNYHFTRKPGFFDVVTYEGASGAQTINHNLGVTPELIIMKKRSEASYYPATVYHGTTGNLFFNNFSSGYGGSNAVNHSNISATTFEVKSGNGDVNDVGETHIAFLFASLSGISKVGSYTGTGSDIDIDCGFTNGARFVLIKRTDSSDNWVVYNTASGINSGNEPYLRLNLDNAEVTGSDRLDPLSSGFTVGTGSFSVNASGGTYLFLAIA